LLALDSGQAVCLYDVATGRERRHLASVHWRGTSPDGRTLAMATEDGAVALVEVATDQERRRFNGGSARAGGMVFAPDGRRLLTDGGDGTALLWDLTGGAKGGLAACERDDVWRDLAADGGRAYDAHWKLVLSPQEAVPLLREKLRPA